MLFVHIFGLCLTFCKQCFFYIQQVSFCAHWLVTILTWLYCISILQVHCRVLLEYFFMHFVPLAQLYIFEDIAFVKIDVVISGGDECGYDVVTSQWNFDYFHGTYGLTSSLRKYQHTGNLHKVCHYIGILVWKAHGCVSLHSKKNNFIIFIIFIINSVLVYAINPK